MGRKKIIFGSTEPQSRKVMAEMRKTMGLPPIKKKAKKKTKT